MTTADIRDAFYIRRPHIPFCRSQQSTDNWPVGVSTVRSLTCILGHQRNEITRDLSVITCARVLVGPYRCDIAIIVFVVQPLFIRVSDPDPCSAAKPDSDPELRNM